MLNTEDACSSQSPYVNSTGFCEGKDSTLLCETVQGAYVQGELSADAGLLGELAPYLHACLYSRKRCSGYPNPVAGPIVVKPTTLEAWMKKLGIVRK